MEIRFGRIRSWALGMIGDIELYCTDCFGASLSGRDPAETTVTTNGESASDLNQIFRNNYSNASRQDSS